MFHCLDLLSQHGRREKETKTKKRKKGTNCFFFTFTTNSPEFCLLSENQKIRIHRESLSFKKKKQIKERKTSKKKPVDFASADS